MPDPLVSLLIGLLVLGLLALLFWPERGLLSRWQRIRRSTRQVQREDALKHMLNAELDDHSVSLTSLAGALQISANQAADLFAELDENDLATLENGHIKLTAAGREAALHILRAHRLWERYLAEKTGFGEDEWHALAEKQEHQLSPQEADKLAQQLGHPTHDPHGDPIPTAAGTMVGHGGRPLTTLQANQHAEIVHLEDEPEAVAAQLVAEGLYPGMRVRVIEQSPERVRFWGEGNEHVLAPIVAANISVVPLRKSEKVTAGKHLATLKPGEAGKVVAISPRCRGSERRRLMDLGVLPGTTISAEMVSPSGDPVAYRIRDALIALREEQAALIEIDKIEAKA